MKELTGTDGRRKSHHRRLRMVVTLLLTASFVVACLPSGCGYSEDQAKTSERSVLERLEREGNVEGYYDYVQLPEMSLAERVEVATRNKSRGQEYVDEVNAEAEELSDRLEDYIRRWLKGDADARLPEGLLPETIDTEDTKDWTLVRPEDVDPEKQWYAIPSHEIDPTFEKCYMIGSEANVTYEKLIYFAPIGSKLLIEGDFPHSRYMNPGQRQDGGDPGGTDSGRRYRARSRQHQSFQGGGGPHGGGTTLSRELRPGGWKRC